MITHKQAKEEIEQLQQNMDSVEREIKEIEGQLYKMDRLTKQAYEEQIRLVKVSMAYSNKRIKQLENVLRKPEEQQQSMDMIKEAITNSMFRGTVSSLLQE